MNGCNYVKAPGVVAAELDLATLYTGPMHLIRSALFTVLMLGSAVAAAETRIALVIGNSNYASGPLPNPANDAQMMADTLTSVGFEVIARRNADQNTMKRAIQDFGARLEKGGPSAVGLFYYAGHGVQLNGRNYLIPTTAQIDREGDVEIEAVSADWVIEQMRYARNRLNIVILDACRNNPFTRSMRSVDHGLATMDAPAGILIAYSTAPGAVAMDGNGHDSPYTEALSQAMRNLHEPVEQVFKHVRVGVMGATANKQVPWESSSLTGDFYFAGAQSSSANVAPALASNAAQSPARAPTVTDESSKESSGGIGSRISGWFGLNKAPEAVKPAASPEPIKPTPAASGNILVAAVPVGSVPGARALPLLQSLGIANGDMDPNQNYPQAAVRQLLEHSPRRVTVGNSAKQIQAALSLCQRHSTSPCKLEMFSDEKTRSITLDPFDLDTLPVSVAQFRQFVDATHYRTDAEKAGFAYAFGDQTSVPQGSWRNGIGHDVSDEAAVIGVSYHDALAYCKYKNQRLPTEDEWEFVARGPDKHTFPWGEDTSLALAAPKTAPHVADGPAEGVGGRYRGLAGNVWQWVDTEINGRKLLKGGSWLETNPAFKRAATRRYDVADRADEDSGFRCAKAAPTWPDAETYVAQLR
jgi:formylglycine-generating enzyme required for sulfatase activity